jgi:hypothetical protein
VTRSNDEVGALFSEYAALHPAHLRHGVGTAQRGRLTKDDVIDAWPEGPAAPLPAQRAYETALGGVTAVARRRFA